MSGSGDCSDSRIIPVLRNTAAAGTSRMINEDEIDFRLTFHENIVRIGGKVAGCGRFNVACVGKSLYRSSRYLEA
jgi:hypothetical protein